MHRDNAYMYCDNYTVISEDGIAFYGCEHNKEEAEAIAKWIRNNTGRATKVIHNTPDQVRESKAIRGGEPLRYQRREEALTDMGVWQAPARRRRTKRTGK